MYLETNLLLCGCFPIVVKSTMAGKIMGINRFLDTDPHPHRSTSCVVNAAGLFVSILSKERRLHITYLFTNHQLKVFLFKVFVSANMLQFALTCLDYPDAKKYVVCKNERRWFTIDHILP